MKNYEQEQERNNRLEVPPGLEFMTPVSPEVADVLARRGFRCKNIADALVMPGDTVSYQGIPP